MPRGVMRGLRPVRASLALLAILAVTRLQTAQADRVPSFQGISVPQERSDEGGMPETIPRQIHQVHALIYP